MPSALANRALLTNAWRRVLTSRHVQYRHCQRRELEAFATTHVDLLSEIVGQLDGETYYPSSSDIVNVPKDGLSDRTYRLLSVPDWVVYTAIVTLIAEAAFPKERLRYNKTVFSHFPRTAKPRPIGFFRKWEGQYSRFNKACKKAAGRHPYLLDFDLASFYDLLDHELLLSKVSTYVTDVYLLDLLRRMLRTWTVGNIQGSFAHGLPQGPEASGFLADLFLYTVDDEIVGNMGHEYVRYVDDFRVFCQSERACVAFALRLEKSVEGVGLVPNSSKTRVVDTRASPGWLREPDYGSFAAPRRATALTRRSLKVRLEHARAKKDFLKHFRRRHASPRDELKVRRSLTRMVPDPDVSQRIVRVYPHRPDSWDLVFLYLLDCQNDPGVQRFCWRRLALPPVRDWESARLIEVAIRTRGNKRLGANQVRTLQFYAAQSTLPLAQAQAVSALLSLGVRKPSLRWLGSLSTQATCTATWLPALLSGPRSKPGIRKSVTAVVRQLMKAKNQKASLVVAYLAGSKLSRADMAQQPNPESVYSRIVLNNIAQLGRPATTDKISPLLRQLFLVTIPPGFDFRSTLSSLDPRWYRQALRQLQLASWYIDTSPTHFVNHIHNFNHVLWHFALRKHGIISSAMKWKNSMGQLTHPAAISNFPTMSAVFDKCRIMRNTNLASHPMDEVETGSRNSSATGRATISSHNSELATANS